MHFTFCSSGNLGKTASPYSIFTLALLLALVLISTKHIRAEQVLIQENASGGILVYPKNPPAKPQPNHRKKADDNVENALALGNSARGTKPPRYRDAERAYWLAANLSPSDPRPYVGLGNIYSDQQRFKEASEAYQKAIELGLRSRGPHLMPKIKRPPPSRNTFPKPPKEPPRYDDNLNGEWFAYLGNALLNQGEFERAGFEFRHAVLLEPTNPQWHALLGNALFAQKRYGDALSSYEKALQLDPKSAIYEKLATQTRTEKDQSILKNRETAQRLVGTSWQVTVNLNESGNLSSVPHGNMKCNIEDGQASCTDEKNVALRFDARWEIEAEAFHFYGDNAYCAGTIQANQMTLNCDNSEMLSHNKEAPFVHWKEVWTRRD